MTQPRPSSRSTRKWLLQAVLLIVVVWIAYRFWLAYQPEPVRLQGQIEAQQYSVSSKVAGRIAEVQVQKGQQLDVGDLVFTLLTPELDAKLEQAKAGEAAAGAVALEAKKGAREQQIAAAKDQWQKAKAGSELSHKTYLRVQNLYQEGVLPLQKRDEAKASWDATRYTEGMAWQEYQMAQEGTRKETQAAAEEKVRMAAGSVAEVEAYLAEARVVSPHTGEVSNVLLRSGEIAPQGFPVVTLLDMSDIWIQLAVREDLLERFAMGTEFEARIPALNNQTFRFKVSYVSVMGDFATWRATDTRQGFDMRTFEVEARPIQPISGLRVGMSALVEM
ncbi:HlyD family secretion protein [Pectobacterium polaris]|uniref:HlyD family secretion protein n=1 Tax=Pectobacterium polaris TaxID=2042057 RepID=UPI002B25006D|nr:efflux RND transporter periplasmic adaptor subunit [Pectobacterium polaris]